MKNRDKLFLSIILTAVAILITAIVFEQTFKIPYLTVIGISIFVASIIGVCIASFVMFIKDLNKALKENSQKESSSEKDEKLIQKYQTAQNKHEREIAKAVLVGEISGVDSAGELVLTSFGLGKEARKSFKTASFKDKFLVVFIYVFIALCFLTFFAGTVLLNFGSIGFVFLGIGAGGFIGFIVVSAIVTKTTNRNYFKPPKQKNPKLKNNKKKKLKSKTYGKIEPGIVKRCFIHSNGKYGTLYTVLAYNENYKSDIRLLSHIYLKQGETVYYRQVGNKFEIVFDYVDNNK